MDIIRPTEMTDAMLTSSTVAEADKAAWAIATAYVAGNQVMVTNHSITATIASNYLASHRGNFVDGNAFFVANATNLLDFVGSDGGYTPYSIELEDSAGKKATGYIAGGGLGKSGNLTEQVLGADVLAEAGKFNRSTDWTWGSGWTIGVRVAVSANGTTVYRNASLVTGQLYYNSWKISPYTSGNAALYLGASTNYYAQRNSAATFTEYGVANGVNVGLNGFSASALTCDDIVVKAVLEPVGAAYGGLHIVNSKNGTYRGWESVESGFNPAQIAKYTISNDEAYHKIYECLVGNTGYFPPRNLTGVSPKWLEIGATNRWKAFDSKYASQTENADSIQYVIEPGSLDSIAFFNLDANSIALVQKQTAGGSTLHSQTITLSGATEAVSLSLHSGYAANELTITITKTGSTAKCGEIVFGLKYNIGKTLVQAGANVGITDYSIFEEDTFGNYTVTARDYSSKGDFQLLLQNTIVDALFELLASYRATPLVFVGYSAYASMILFGYYRNFLITMNSPTTSNMEISIEGLV